MQQGQRRQRGLLNRFASNSAVEDSAVRSGVFVQVVRKSPTVRPFPE